MKQGGNRDQMTCSYPNFLAKSVTYTSYIQFFKLHHVIVGTM